MRFVIDNVRIRTPEPSNATVLVVEDGAIVGVGRGSGVDGSTPRLDGGGATVVPGFVDAHGHLLAFAATFSGVDCRGASSIDAIATRIRERASDTPPGEWIRAFGYDENDLRERRHPTRRDLDRTTDRHPVRLYHRGGHAIVLNSLALERCHISVATEEPPGGHLDRELPSGEPSGVLFEMSELIESCVPPLPVDERNQGVQQAEAMLLSRGVTAFHDTGSRNGPNEWRTLAGLCERGLFRLRLLAMTGSDAFERGDRIADHAPALIGSHVKIMLSELGAALAPTCDELADRVRRVHDAGLDVAIHAVTETGVRAAADAIIASLEARPRQHRHRIEHASICTPEVIHALAKHRITVVTQPGFIAVNGDRYLRTVPHGELRHLYPIGDLAAAGVPLAFGSDCPVAEPDPIGGIIAAITRRTAAGAALPGTPMLLDDALHASTSGAAAAMGVEQHLGALRPAMHADFVLLSGTFDAADGIVPQVEATFIAGEPQYASPRFAERLANTGLTAAARHP